MSSQQHAHEFDTHRKAKVEDQHANKHVDVPSVEHRSEEHEEAHKNEHHARGHAEAHDESHHETVHH
ncbi:MAG TPA: hypothetical protein VF666_11395 [Pyrinomonadaceae bacterium]